MTALLAANSNEAPKPASRSRGLYTYLVKPVGAVTTVASADVPEELVMRANLSRQDGTTRQHTLRVRNTERQPDLVSRVRDLLSKNVAVRMVVRFENVIQNNDGNPGLRTQAIAESLLEPARTPASVQLDLFG